MLKLAAKKALGADTEESKEWSIAPDTSRASVIRIVDAYYKDKANKEARNNDRKRGCFHPSQLTRCRRKQQYDFILAPKQPVTIPPIMRRIWDNGHSSEGRLRHATAEGAKILGIGFTPSIKISIPSLMVYGETDGMLEYSHNGHRWLLDYKTVKREDFAKLKSGEKKPSLAYVVQLITYMRALRIGQGILYFENKDSQDQHEFVIRYDSKLWKSVVKEVIRPVQRATYEERLIARDNTCSCGGKKPTCECESNKCEGEMCPYFNICITKDLPFDAVDERMDTHKKRLQLLME